MKNNSLINFGYILLVGICIGISVYSSYRGLESLFLNLAAAAAAIIGIVLFAADMKIRSSLLSQSSVIPAMLLFGLAMVFSGTSNMNFFYTNFMSATIVKEAYRDSWPVFQKNMQKANLSIENSVAYKNTAGFRERIDTEIGKLKAQVLDPIRPGVGSRAEEIIKSIDNLLLAKFGTRLTRTAAPYVPPQGDLSPLSRWFDGFERQITNIVDNGFSSEDAGVRSLKRKVLASLELFKSRIPLLNSAQADQNNAPRVWLSEMAGVSQEVENEINNGLDGMQRVQFEPISRNLGRVGEIPFTLESAFVDVPSLPTTILATAISIFIDLLPLLYALALIRPEKLSPDEDRVARSKVRKTRRKRRQGGVLAD